MALVSRVRGYVQLTTLLTVRIRWPPPHSSTPVSFSLSLILNHIHFITVPYSCSYGRLWSDRGRWSWPTKIEKYNQKFLFIPLFKWLTYRSDRSPNFHTCGSNVVDSRKCVPFLALVDIAVHSVCQNAPKTPIFWTCISVFQPNAPNIEMFILPKLMHRSKLSRVIETPITLCGWSKYAPNKSKIADGRHLEKSKNRYIYTTNFPFLTKFGRVTFFSPPDLLFK